MNKEIKQLKEQIEQILEKANCHTSLQYRDGCDVYTAEGVEEAIGGIFVLFKSKVQTGMTRVPFKPSRPSFNVPQHIEDEIFEILRQHGYEKTNDFSSGCYWQLSFKKVS
ncbi:MAG: hypothetical protein NC218_02010 [Acetobacter sp.]|nr:hypothetical protein [Acetobacter sp.]